MKPKFLLGLLTILAALLLVAWTYQQLPMQECAWCQHKHFLNRHHVVPQSVNPDLRDNPTNLVVLCRRCHFCLAHRCNWRTYNPDILTIIQNYTNSLPCGRHD